MFQKKMSQKDFDAQKDYYESLDILINSISEQLKISKGAAASIWYLRQRSRWTQELEDYLIYLDQNSLRIPPIGIYDHQLMESMKANSNKFVLRFVKNHRNYKKK